MMAKVEELTQEGDTENTTVIVSNKHQEEEKEGVERSWSDLNPELLCLILKHLCAWDCNTFRAICRSWRSVPAVMWSPPPSNDSPLFQGPSLLSFNENNHRWNFFNPICNATCHMDMPEVSNARIRFSKYGWLLMSQGNHGLFFFNPITKVKIKLPDKPEEAAFLTMCFSAPPNSSNCVIVGIRSYADKWNRGFIYIGMLKHGEKSWTMFESQCYQLFQLSICNPVMHNGVFYCLDVSGHVGIFDPSNEEDVWQICTYPIGRPIRNCQQSYMVESDGDLLAVFIPNDGSQVYLFKLVLSEMVWEWLESLGNKMLYISHCTSFSKTAVVNGTSDKIYLPRLYDNHCVFYSFATQRYHTFLGSYSGGDFLDMNVKTFKHCTWIEPMLTSNTSCVN